MRQLKQIGVDYVLMGGGRTPWTEQALRETMERYKAGGITVINMMIGGLNDIIHGGPNRDREIENIIQSIRAAGKAGFAGDRVQLLRPPSHGRLQGGNRTGWRRLHGV